jgi:predicted 3-demethylubiquinone-9 3-methyltransferase (glyoxalase superfamily)
MREHGMSKRLTPCLWFDTQAEEAADFYVGLFPNSKITGMSRYGDAGPMPKGTVLTVEFELEGRPFTALNGGPHYKFNEAVSFQIYCDSQAEIDRYWNALISDGGEESMCGWCKDRFGLSWQVVPNRLIELITDPDAAKARRVTDAMFKMRKLDIATLEAAAKG